MDRYIFQNVLKILAKDGYLENLIMSKYSKTLKASGYHLTSVRFDFKMWNMSSRQESLNIPLWSATLHGWSNPFNLAIYRRHCWKMATASRKLP